jgi:hypothetical protein
MAQETQTEKPKHSWKTGGMLTIMGGQTGTRNWAPTGSEKFSFSAYGSLQLWANTKWGDNSWENNFDFSYGLLHTKSQGSRKVDDKLDFYSKYSYSISKNSGFGFIGALRSQFTNGYDYTETPKKRISGFFAPAYLTLSPGFQIKSSNNSFSFHIGPDVRWVIVTNEPYSLVYQGGIKPDGSTERTLAELYNVSPGKEVRVEAGLYLSALYKKEVCKNVLWKTRLDLNSDFRESDPFAIDVYWTNNIGMTVNKWLKVNYNFDLYHDKDVKMFGASKNETRTQMKSMLGVGLGLSF